jgi:hypothetical protein
VSAVYFDDMQDAPVFDDARTCSFRIRIRPDTAGEDALVHASLSMIVKLGCAYPAKPAEVEIDSCVGLSDGDVSQLRGALATAGAEMASECSLFHLLQTAKDFVNSRNTPSDDCCICLCAFDKDEQFFKTTCGHCFHLPCVYMYVYVCMYVCMVHACMYGG